MFTRHNKVQGTTHSANLRENQVLDHQGEHDEQSAAPKGMPAHQSAPQRRTLRSVRLSHFRQPIHK